MSLVEQELLTIPEHLSSPPVFSGIFSFICMFCRSLFCPFVLFLFAHCVVCSSSIYRFWLLFWYHQTLLMKQDVLSFKVSSLSIVFCEHVRAFKTYFSLVVALSGSCFLSFVFHCSHLSIFVAQLILSKMEIILWNENFQYSYVFSFLY